MGGHSVQVGRLGLGFDQRQQGVDGVFDRAHERNIDGNPSADIFTAHIDLDHRDARGIERAVREIGAEHQQRVAVLHRPVARAEPDQPGHPHVKPVVVLDEVLAAEGVHDRRLQSSRETEKLVVRTGAPRAGEDGHAAGRVQHAGRGRE
jgi:hypothetical protein